MSNLLIDEYPLILLPSLAKAIGLNEAIVLQQVHYWMRHATHTRAGHLWIFKTYEEWQKEFPFWSLDTIERTIRRLEKKDLVISGRFNRMAIDKTKWYRPNYEIIATLQIAVSTGQSAVISSPQSAVIDAAICGDGSGQLALFLPETTTEIPEEIIQRWEAVLSTALLQLPKTTAEEFRHVVPTEWADGILTIKVNSASLAERFNVRMKKIFDRSADGQFEIVAVS